MKNRVKEFENELYYFLNKIKSNENFALNRWNDGEMIILENKFIDLVNAKNGEFKYDPSDDKYKVSRELLEEAFKYKDKNYYVGIACKCCVGDEKHQFLKTLSDQNENNLTWGNIFVNSNYNLFINNYLDEFSKKDIYMVVNEKCNINLLDFDVKKAWYVGKDAWYNNLSLIDEIKDYMKEKDVKNSIFLLASGPLSNIIGYELWKFNKENTYLDVGSTLDVKLGLKPTRGYLLGGATLNKKCIW